MCPTEPPVYRVIFLNQGKIFEIFARHVSQGGLFGFVEVEEVLFGERSSLVIDPSEDQLKNEFEGVERTFIPLHSVVRIDQVKRQGTARIVEGKTTISSVTPFPVPFVPRGNDSPT